MNEKGQRFWQWKVSFDEKVEEDSDTHTQMEWNLMFVNMKIWYF